MQLELAYFCAAVFFGVTAALCYHLLLLFRTVCKHSTAVTDAEDILFFAAAGVAFFLTSYEKNNGILRWYAFAGAGIGILAYIRTLGVSLELLRKLLLQKAQKAVKIKKKFRSKGRVSLDEGSSPEHKNKKKKKKRT